MKRVLLSTRLLLSMFPTNRSFPCTQQRPPNLKRQAAENMMYIANHNLNTEISLAGTSLLVPTTALINQTNALNGSGSLGLMASKALLVPISVPWVPTF